MKHRLLVLLLALVITPMAMLARNYDVSLKDATPEVAFQTIKKVTGYEFVYNKGALNELENHKISGDFHNMSLEQILNRVVMFHLGLDYSIVDKTIVLSKSEAKFYKSTIAGQVMDEAGEPLAGATVSVPGTPTVVATDIDGQFSMLVESKTPRIEVSYVGMKTATVKVTATQRFYVIKMQVDPTLMNEVVVTGYQNLKRENATGAYQTITSEDIDRRVSGSIVENLEGKIPGLVTYSNGTNGSGEDAMTIRGVGTLNAKSSPLIVVDGLPIEGGIETVNPYDIQNITVLKDAAASSIYGARASNGVIVITTKQANNERVSVDFNADWTISEKVNYKNFNWVSAAELLELEKYNFNSIVNNPDQNTLLNMLDRWNEGRISSFSIAQRKLMANYTGMLSDEQLNADFAEMGSKDYRKEWDDAWNRNRVTQQYNIAMRVQSNVLASSIMVNYRRDNQGVYREHNDELTFKYKGDLHVSKWLDMSFGVNVINERAKQHISSFFGYSDINSFAPYQSMYNEDGTLARMEADVPLDHEAFSNPGYELKDGSYNLLKERDMNWDRTRRTNVRTYLRGIAKILPGWTASAHFQYEDIYYKNESYYEPNSFEMRSLFNTYTQGGMMPVRDYIDIYDPNFDWDNLDWDSVKYDDDYNMYTEHMEYKPTTHNIPDGGRLDVRTSEGSFWTFRAQTQYNRKFAEKHSVDVLGGFEFRSTRTRTTNNIYLGYDDQTQTNANGVVNWGTLSEIMGSASVFGNDYLMYGAPSSQDGIFATTDILHRFYSLYMTGNYVYDSRYAVSGSWRIDKTDLFGADPKFRGRPLWSVGGSWNIHNEDFMKDYTWINALKPRVSYGITGNIDSNVSSYLTATIGTRWLNGQKMATLDTAPNDQLRWEKTTTFNVGLDFAFWNYRLSGSVDYYHKNGSDLLTITDLDPTTGWTSLNINNGRMTNKGFEMQLNGHILEAKNRNQLGINASFNISYNHNEVTHVDHEVSDGYQTFLPYTFHVGYPVHSLFSYRYGGMEREDNQTFVNWIDNDGQKHKADVVYDSEFTPEQAVYSGSLDPKVAMNFMPEFTYKGFTLSAMFTSYGGHVMRYEDGAWGKSISASSSRVLLDYWKSGESTDYVPNGYLGNYISCLYPKYRDTNVLPADYMKLRNIVLSYNFPRNLVRHIGLNDLRLRFQMNNVATWVRNDKGVDPEAVSPLDGTILVKTPKSYTFSIFFNI